MLSDINIKELIEHPIYLVRLFAIQSAFLFASMYFRKNALLKVGVFLAVLFIIFLLVIHYTGIGRLMMVVDDPNQNGIFFTDINGVYSTDLLSYILFFKYKWLFMKVLWYIAPVFFWILSYLRLKETEV
jgi:hypothetical protein